MCGRFALHLAHGEIRQIPGHDDVEADEWIDEDEFVPRYNIAPRTYAPVLRRGDPGPSSSSSDGERYVLQSMKWGLIPHWSKHEDKTLSTFNARSESLIEGGHMWASIKGKKRCAVLCQGYYEWLTKGKEKLPHFVRHKDGRLMLLAGLYDCVTLEGQTKPLWTFTVVTTDANKELEWLHDRQPVILPTREALDKWLDTSSQTWTSELTKLVQPYHDAKCPLECYQVPKEVGKVGTESSTFIEPITSRKDGIQAMFSKQAKTSDSKHPAVKRSRSKSPAKVHDLTADSPPPTKKAKVEKRKSEKGNSDVAVVGGPSTPKKPGAEESKHASTKSPTKRKSPRKTRDVDASESASPAKITSFFHKG
ncbi:hypothetical protein Hypma_009219 [Hypsizygus marmoreus]|uniref:DUF159-domain-containing protein n=1 Tax=Hypsizygus marmoreus TaxID=39966 RepID=A0A369JQB3_HYPMA|nr:hypothetical protein Hypma_009219 [Hypsizygus marmoreus]